MPIIILIKNTRTFRVSIILRNLGDTELYYAGATVDFFFSATGKLTKKVFVSYIPIVQYYYGLDGYPWLFKDVIVFEVIFLLVFSVYFVRECMQLMLLLLPLRQPKVGIVDAPVDTESGCDKNVRGRSIEMVGESGSSFNVRADEDLAVSQADDGSTKHDTTYSGSDTDKSVYMNLLDWVTVVAIAIAIGYRLQIIMDSADIHNYMTSIGPDYDDHVESILEKFYAVENDMIVLNGVAIVLVFLGLAQFFRYMAFNPRLGIVTSTIAHAAGDLGPVLIIFIVVLTAYGVLGTAIYGHKLTAWSNLGNSIATLFIMILGEFSPYFDMKSVKPQEMAVFSGASSYSSCLFYSIWC